MKQQSIQQYEFKEEVKLGFELVELSQLYAQHEALLTVPHRANFYHILWFAEQATQHFVDFQTIDIQPNTLLFVNKDAVNRFAKNPNVQAKGIVFLDSFFCKDAEDSSFLQKAVCFNSFYGVSKIVLPNENKTFKSIWEQLEQELQQAKDTFQIAILRNLLHNFILHAERILQPKESINAPNNLDLDITLAFKKHLDNHFKEEKSIGFFAQLLHITEYRLYHATKSILGKSPKQLVDERIILEAKRLLAHSPKNIKEIGFELGFEEATNFNKFFKKHTSLTPIEFRNSQK